MVFQQQIQLQKALNNNQNSSNLNVLKKLSKNTPITSYLGPSVPNINENVNENGTENDEFD